MSAHIRTHLRCNGSSKACEVRFGEQEDHLSASTHRENARRAGWHNYSARDYCPACWAVMTTEQRKARR